MPLFQGERPIGVPIKNDFQEFVRIGSTFNRKEAACLKDV